MSKEEKRVTYLDALRIFAIFMVIYLHTGKNGVLIYALTDNPLEKTLGYSLAVLTSELPVPLFFMISGALLLGREESYQLLFKKRILKIIYVLFFFSFFMYCYRSLTGVFSFSASDFFTKLFTSQVYPSYWFLYAYIAYLLMLPFLRKLVRHLETKDYIYLFLLQLAIGTIPAVITLWKHNFTLNTYFVLPLLETTTLYPLLGYGISHTLEDKYFTNKNLNYGVFLSLISFGVTILFSWIKDMPYEDFTNFDKGIFQSSFMDIMVITIFFGAKYLESQKAPFEERAFDLSKVSKCVFGIYLIEPVIREQLMPLLVPLKAYIGCIPMTLLWTLCVFTIAGCIVMLAKKVSSYLLQA